MSTGARNRQGKKCRAINGGTLTVTISFSPEPDADDRISKVARILLAHNPQ